MHADDVEVQRLALTAYRAATDPALWGELIRDAAQAVGATGASIFTPQLDPEGRMLMAAWGSTAAAMDPYLKHWVTEDAWALGARQKDFFHQAGEVRFGEEAITTPGLRSTRFYADFARQFDIEGVLVLNVAGDHDPFTPLTHFSLARAPGMAFSDDDQRLLRTLWPDLRQALHAYWALRALHGHNRHIEAAVDDLPQPAWVLRADATIEFSNREAMRVAAANRWVRTSLGRLRGIGNLEQADLMEALRAAVLGKGSALVASLAEARKLERLVLRIAPLAAESPYLAVWPRACALLLLDVPVPPDSDAQWLARAVQQFHLTGAEARLLRKFATGEAVTAVAKQAGLSIHTVRSHLRSIYEKTGCHRQAELMQMFGRH